MFKLEVSPHFWSRVEIPVPGGGTQALRLRFKTKTKRELAALRANESGMDDFAIVREIVVDWQDGPGDFSAEALDRLVDTFPGAAFAILEAYFNGHAGAKAKN